MSSDNGGIIGVVNNPTGSVASGVWQQEEQYEAKVNNTWPQRQVFTTRSLRFNNDSSDFLFFTPLTTTNRRTFTISFWFKTTTVAGGNNYMFSTGNYASGDGLLQMNLSNSGRLTVNDYDQSGDSYNLRWVTPSTYLIRDPGAWYHFVLAVDSTQGTQSNRAKVYLNGVDISSDFTQTTSPAQNDDFHINTAGQIQQVGRSQADSDYYDGYLTEFIVVDGQQLAPTSFGVANSDGVWTPIPYTGTFGTNGFNLQFENAAALGDDSSGNDNDFTVNALASIDQSTDYPVINHATLNPVYKSSSQPTFSEGNLRQTPNAGAYQNAFSTIGVTSGKWYAEMKVNGSANSANYYGVVAETEYDYLQTAANVVGTTDKGFSIAMASGDKRTNGSNTSYGSALANTDIFMIALDIDNAKVWFGKNGTWFASGNPASGSNAAFSSINTAYPYFFGGTLYSGGYSSVDWNFGSPSYSISSSNADGNGYGNFEYAVPSGFYALNTKNLAEFG
tara:strand:+ start:629 stop:2137 length:1509 start_codon:yes stop_codon:yes gene_type:complete